MKFFATLPVASFALFAGLSIAQMVLSTDGSDPSKWDPKLDAIRSAPANHRIIFENDDIRVLSVTVKPGELEKVHHHQWPSVMVIDSLTKLADFDKNGKEQKLPLPDKIELPLVLRLPPQSIHAVKNLDTRTFHATRIEFKKGFPVQQKERRHIEP